ncbi:protein-disulfide reductase DsbD family protein [Planctomycetota bacterium]
MHKHMHTTVVLWVLCILSPWAATADTDSIELARLGEEYSQVRLATAARGDQRGIAAHFSGSEDMHYYATAGSEDIAFFQLEVTAQAEGMTWGETIYPPPGLFFDHAQNKNIEVYVGDFIVFLPIKQMPSQATDVTVTISAQTCTSDACLMPFDKEITLAIDRKTDTWPTLAIQEKQPPPPPSTEADAAAGTPQSTWLLFLLAIAAGMSINIMPCVLPVIPLIIMKLLEQSKQAGKQRIAAGMAFCIGIVAFFAVFAAITAIVQVVTGQGINPNDMYRYPNAAITLFLFIVFFGLVMLDVVPIVLPTALTGKDTSASSLAGSLGMGFFAGVLSIPCSGALLGFVLVWAQTQPLSISSLAFILIGVGMALPYAILISIPSLMSRLPKPGTWMVYFKKTCGFLLFFIAGKLTLAAIPDKDRLINVTLYGIVFAFCVWMWGMWVDFSTPPSKKRLIRGIALLLAVGAGFWLLPDTSPPAESTLAWKHYDADLVQQALADERPVLLKFTADWCTNCKVVERKVYRDPDMVATIEQRNVLPIKADTTTKDMAATIDLVSVYGEAGNVPVTILLLPGQAPHKLRGIDIGEDLLALLEPLPIVTPSDAEEI